MDYFEACSSGSKPRWVPAGRLARCLALDAAAYGCGGRRGMGGATSHWPVCIPGVSAPLSQTLDWISHSGGVACHNFDSQSSRQSSEKLVVMSACTCRFLALCLIIPFLWYQSQRYALPSWLSNDCSGLPDIQPCILPCQCPTWHHGVHEPRDCAHQCSI